MRLLCDEMLGRLGRWLRAAGYDTLVAEPGSDDRHLFQTAIADQRLLLTRDRGLAARTGAGRHVVVLDADGVPAQAREVVRRLAVDWLHAPFSRCVVDNAVLREAAHAEVEAAPPLVRAMGGPFLACPRCGRLYWEGSHHRRMLARLRSWRGSPGAA